MNCQELILHLEKVNTISNEDWFSSLSERKLEELAFHNRERDKNFIQAAQQDQDVFEKFYGNKKYYQTVGLSENYIHRWIASNCKDKIFLDYACGNGKNALLAAKYGAALSIGLDISDVSVNNAKVEAERQQLSNTFFVQADAERTLLPDNSIDLVICSGMLHHLDLSYAFPELRRILKPGGKILAIEALDYNPLIKLYRYLTPNMRTEWEKAHILGLQDIKFAKRFFIVENIKYWHVLSYLAGKFPWMLSILNGIDRFVTRIPLVQLMAWIFTFELVKQED